MTNCLFLLLRGPVFQQYDGLASQGALRPGPRALPPVGRADGHLRALDQLSLRHMAQDCTSVKNQLLKLKTLLQVRHTRLRAHVRTHNT